MPNIIDMARASVWVHPQPELREKADTEQDNAKPKEKRALKAAKEGKQEEETE